MEKKTPLYQWHEDHGGKIVPFAGYLLPVQYQQGVIAEHNAVREAAGFFDVSHMGEFVIRGRDALASLERIMTNSFTGMDTGRVRYTLMCNEAGGVVDDLVVCKMGADRYMLVVNAANREKDASWVKERLSGDSVLFEDISDSIAQIAIQGPASQDILASVSKTIPQKYYTLIENGNVAGINCIVSRTGYTGETGFELYVPAEKALSLWESLLDAGRDAGLVPCGLGARDTLRLEAAMPLYGHEMDESITPFEAALGFAVRMNKPDFIGKKTLLEKENPPRIRVGLKVTGRGIVREHSDVFFDGSPVGKTTSGTFCPWLKGSYAMALLNVETAMPGTQVIVDVRGRAVEAEVCPLPFYTKR
ncbi:MAG: glycine cleavage system aminomethyltransferase GcvT [Spirochaetaceae bacterium]|nr:glycine cleavage system aminomethyltransferase GcvT [Spirochaetaceae bacterium]